MKNANEDIRQVIRDKRIYHWELASALGVSEATLCRWLRVELTADLKAKVFAAIDRISGGADK